MKKNIKRTFSIFMIIELLVQAFAPILVFATTIASEDGNVVTIGGDPTINGNNFKYQNGNMTITKNGNQVNTTSFSVALNDEIIITLMPDANYNAQLHDNNNNSNVTLDNNTYSFKIAHAISSTLSFTPSFNKSNSSAQKFDFTINGESFTNVSIGDRVLVTDDFNLNTITEFYVTKIAIDGGDTYTYAPGEYSYNLLDAEGRRIFETNYKKISENSGSIRIISHSGDILTKDLAKNKSVSDYLEFYITSISFVKEDYRGVEISTEVMPDNYDFTIWNGVDLSSTTKSSPGIASAYYNENTITLTSDVSSQIKKISLMTDSLVPSSAVQINNDTKKVTLLSNYYNEIPLKIELEDGTIGYVTIKRIGIFISDVNQGNDTLFHGAIAQISGNLNVDINKYRIAAVFYHEDTKTYQDYDLIVNVTYKDGKTETKIAQGVGDIQNRTGNIIGSDYILWKGDIASSPLKVSVIAVNKGSINSDSTTFSGATFGTGAGVEWERN